MNWEERSIKLMVFEGKRWERVKKSAKKGLQVAAIGAGTVGLGIGAGETAKEIGRRYVKTETCPTCGEGITKQAKARRAKGKGKHRDIDTSHTAGAMLKMLGHKHPPKDARPSKR